MTKDGSIKSMQTFARNLYKRRMELGLSQSELARKIWGTTVDARGYQVAKSRDRISSWESGKQIPSMDNLVQLAEALGMEPAQLAPELVNNNLQRVEPNILMTMVEGQPDRVHLKINVLTSLALASQVIALLSQELAEKK